MNASKLVKWLGWVLIAIGVLGFIGIISPGGMLFGVFSVDPMHNIVHLLTGILAIVFAGSAAKTYLKVIGVIYLVITIWGYFMPDVLGMTMNMADGVLHLIIALLALYYGFKKDMMMASPSMPQSTMS